MRVGRSRRTGRPVRIDTPRRLVGNRRLPVMRGRFVRIGRRDAERHAVHSTGPSSSSSGSYGSSSGTSPGIGSSGLNGPGVGVGIGRRGPRQVHTILDIAVLRTGVGNQSTEWNMVPPAPVRMDVRRCPALL
ncbi:hypothetical protein GDI0642 [Gluconacetobacter diazotrophicus PA1 5]|uniref:Uncharacterized protein n=1 Tax=Gluconacetobacter diazotrophicus (strain ATCC 49037 / DSM 5601 / CCUG 37298 / CIP 103539 / LMG 7603 / PAl5) TaxID=272568 RepID=A9H8X2_GLUDA|nr:hypothetical protein GDI0642 [Gluconacetobacter diazotrophicus PA1 5]